MSKDYVMQLEATIQNLRRDNQLLKEAKDKQEQVLNEALKLNGEWAEELDNYKDLEEQLGCPLEVREKALIKDFIWYDDNGRLIQVIPMNSGYIMEKGKKIAVLNCIYNFNFWLAIKCKDYKKTWWLKEDRSE